MIPISLRSLTFSSGDVKQTTLQTGDFLPDLEGITVERAADEDEPATPENAMAQRARPRLPTPTNATFQVRSIPKDCLMAVKRS